MEEAQAVDELVGLLKPFVVCEMYSIVDRLANATGKEAVISALYEALRAARSAFSREDRCLCEDEQHRCKARAYVPKDDAVKHLINKLDEDLLGGLELVRKIVIRALAK